MTVVCFKYPVNSKLTIFEFCLDSLLSESSEMTTVETLAEEEERSKESDIGDMDIEFYKSDRNIPSRFLPLPEEIEEEAQNVKEDSETQISKCITDDSEEVVVDDENTEEQKERKKMEYNITVAIL